MSHFTVLVISDGKSTVEELLAPYDEGREVSPYIEKTKEELIQEAKGFKAEIQNNQAENKEIDKTGLELINASTDEELYKVFINNWYPTDYYKFDTEGNLLSTYNRESQWDWYSIGGRWDGYLKKKDGTSCSSGKISDLDFSLNKTLYKKAERWWEVVVENSPLRKDENKKDFISFLKTEYFVKEYKTKENYAERQALFSTYAVLTPDGEWHSKGDMGWFGISANDDENWEKNYRKTFLDNLSPDCEVTLVDCHI